MDSQGCKNNRRSPQDFGRRVGDDVRHDAKDYVTKKCAMTINDSPFQVAHDVLRDIREKVQINFHGHHEQPHLIPL